MAGQPTPWRSQPDLLLGDGKSRCFRQTYGLRSEAGNSGGQHPACVTLLVHPGYPFISEQAGESRRCFMGSFEIEFGSKRKIILVADFPDAKHRMCNPLDKQAGLSIMHGRHAANALVSWKESDNITGSRCSLLDARFPPDPFGKSSCPPLERLNGVSCSVFSPAGSACGSGFFSAAAAILIKS